MSPIQTKDYKPLYKGEKKENRKPNIRTCRASGYIYLLGKNGASLLCTPLICCTHSSKAFNTLDL